MKEDWFMQHTDTISMRKIFRRFIRGISCFVVIPMCLNVQSIRIIFIWIPVQYPFQKKKAGMDTWYMKTADSYGRMYREKRKCDFQGLPFAAAFAVGFAPGFFNRLQTSLFEIIKRNRGRSGQPQRRPQALLWAAPCVQRHIKTYPYSIARMSLWSERERSQMSEYLTAA